MIEEAIYLHLKNHPGLSALIGTRIYPLRMPQNPTLPAVVYQRISTPRTYSHSGYSNLADPRFQFSVWAESYSGALAVAEQLRDAINGFTGSGSIPVYSSQIANESDDYEPSTELYRILIDAFIAHRE